MQRFEFFDYAHDEFVCQSATNFGFAFVEFETLELQRLFDQTLFELYDELVFLD